MAKVNVDWYDLPTWVKNGITGSRAEIDFWKSCRWIETDEVYEAIAPDGTTAGTFSLE